MGEHKSDHDDEAGAKNKDTAKDMHREEVLGPGSRPFNLLICRWHWLIFLIIVILRIILVENFINVTDNQGYLSVSKI